MTIKLKIEILKVFTLEFDFASGKKKEEKIEKSATTEPDTIEQPSKGK